MEEGHGELLQWAGTLGVTDSSTDHARGFGSTLRVAMFPDEGGRGLAAVRNVEQGEMILRVPHSALIGVHSARRDPGFKNILDQFTHLSSVQVLVVYLLSEIGKARLSKWYPYFKHLPREHHTLACFSASQAEALQVEDAVWAAKRSLEASRKEWEEASPLLSKLQLKQRYTTFKAWLWASATVSSRTLHVPWDEAGVLCPIGDLFNYEAPTESSSPPDMKSREARLCDAGYDFSTNSYCFYARKNYKKDQQILLCYGLYTNLELLEHYGFLLENNPNDAVHLMLPTSTEPGFECGTDCTKQRTNRCCWIEAGGSPSFSLLEALRLRSVGHSQSKSQLYLAMQGMPISKESDLTVFRWLMSKCKSVLEKLPTSITDDVVLLELLQKGSDEKLRLAVQWRLGYKMILQGCIAHSQVIMSQR